MIHHRLFVWEKSVEAPVENPSGNERVNVADSKSMQVHGSAYCIIAFSKESSMINGTFAISIRHDVEDLQMLPSNRHAGGAQTCDDDAVDKARKWWDTANEEGSNSAPIGGELG